MRLNTGDVYTPKELIGTDENEAVNHLAFSPDGLHVSLCKGKVVSVYNTKVLHTRLLFSIYLCKLIRDNFLDGSI